MLILNLIVLLAVLTLNGFLFAEVMEIKHDLHKLNPKYKPKNR